MRKCNLDCEAQQEGFCCSKDVWGKDFSETCKAKTNEDLIDENDICPICYEEKDDGMNLDMAEFKRYIDSDFIGCSKCWLSKSSKSQGTT